MEKDARAWSRNIFHQRHRRAQLYSTSAREVTGHTEESSVELYEACVKAGDASRNIKEIDRSTSAKTKSEDSKRK